MKRSFMSKYSMGIMQGRLTPMKGRGIQFFPFENWKQEFFLAKKLGIDEIEYIFDYDHYENNPIWTASGLNELGQIIQETGVSVKAVCFDYFMRRPFYKYADSKQILEENKQILRHVLINMKVLGIDLIEIPLVDDSSLKSEDEKEGFKKMICGFADEFHDIRFGLETDLPPQLFRRFLQEIARDNVGANYDSGNSSGLGYEPYEEVTSLGEYIYNVHIKDRVYKGTTVELGAGSADFEALFKGLQRIKYSGSFILQAARGEDGLEENKILNQKAFLSRYIDTYL